MAVFSLSQPLVPYGLADQLVVVVGVFDQCAGTGPGAYLVLFFNLAEEEKQRYKNEYADMEILDWSLSPNPDGSLRLEIVDREGSTSFRGTLRESSAKSLKHHELTMHQLPDGGTADNLRYYMGMY